jgi:hypothetical protein
MGNEAADQWRRRGGGRAVDGAHDREPYEQYEDSYGHGRLLCPSSCSWPGKHQAVHGGGHQDARGRGHGRGGSTRRLGQRTTPPWPWSTLPPFANEQHAAGCASQAAAAVLGLGLGVRVDENASVVSRPSLASTSTPLLCRCKNPKILDPSAATP